MSSDLAGVPDLLRAAQIAVFRGLEGSTVVLSGGVFQYELLQEEIRRLVAPALLDVWTNREVPANDGGISLGQAATVLQA